MPMPSNPMSRGTSGRLRRFRPWAVTFIAPLALGCDTNLKPEPIPAADSLYWALDLNHRAVTLSATAPYDTLTLVATPRNYRREPILGLPAPQYSSSNIELVTIEPGGMLRAFGLTSQPVVIRVKVTVGNLTHRDSMLVRVVGTTPPPVLAGVSAAPVPPDSARRSVLGNGPAALCVDQVASMVSARAVDADDQPMSDVMISFRSSDLTIATLLNELTGEFRAHERGTVDFRVSATLFGVVKADTVTYRIGWPLTGNVDLDPDANGAPFIRQPEVKIAPGGIVSWTNASVDMETDITFSDPTNVLPLDVGAALFPSGFYEFCRDNVMLIADGGTVAGNFVLGPNRRELPALRIARSFPLPGTYEYSSARHGISGRIVVVDE